MNTPPTPPSPTPPAEEALRLMRQALGHISARQLAGEPAAVQEEGGAIDLIAQAVRAQEGGLDPLLGALGPLAATVTDRLQLWHKQLLARNQFDAGQPLGRLFLAMLAQEPQGPVWEAVANTRRRYKSSAFDAPWVSAAHWLSEMLSNENFWSVSRMGIYTIQTPEWPADAADTLALLRPDNKSTFILDEIERRALRRDRSLEWLDQTRQIVEDYGLMGEERWLKMVVKGYPDADDRRLLPTRRQQAGTGKDKLPKGLAAVLLNAGHPLAVSTGVTAGRTLVRPAMSDAELDVVAEEIMGRDASARFIGRAERTPVDLRTPLLDLLRLGAAMMRRMRALRSEDAPSLKVAENSDYLKVTDLTRRSKPIDTLKADPPAVLEVDPRALVYNLLLPMVRDSSEAQARWAARSAEAWEGLARDLRGASLSPDAQQFLAWVTGSALSYQLGSAVGVAHASINFTRNTELLEALARIQAAHLQVAVTAELMACRPLSLDEVDRKILVRLHALGRGVLDPDLTGVAREALKSCWPAG